MIAAAPRAGLAIICLAILTPGCSKAAPPAPAAPRFNLQVVVGGCYTHSDIRVSIDGRPLALTPLNRRENTAAVCYSELMALGAAARVDVDLRGHISRVDVRPNTQSRYLVINPDYAPYAELSHEAPMFD